ncbi:MAG: dTDP-4-dehydrorhamnose reductase [Rubripirellula sp.]|nr:dTDP-4-dehydrorhamnose reductase [Rubripirellula sp.]
MSRARNFLVIGSSGMLGHAVVEELSHRGLPFTTIHREQLDLLDPNCLESIPASFSHIINCAGYTQVDQAEKEEELATRINGDAISELAKYCHSVDATLVHYSSDYVFNGCQRVPYRIDHPRDPVNAYGRSKAKGEEALESSDARFLCLRTSWLYAPWGNNFVLTMKHLMEERSFLKVINDQQGSPTSCHSLARVTLDLVNSEATGFHHATDAGECSWFDFAQEIKRQLKYTCDIEACTSAEFIRPAKRPSYSVLDISATEKITGPARAWKENLREMLCRVS